MRSLSFMVVIALLLMPTEAQLGQLHVQHMELSHVVNWSPVIAVVRFLDPPRSTTPFTYVVKERSYEHPVEVWSLEIVEFIKNEAKIGAGQIKVVGRYAQDFLKQVADYEVQGKDVSPSRLYYESSLSPADISSDLRVIAFLAEPRPFPRSSWEEGVPWKKELLDRFQEQFGGYHRFAVDTGIEAIEKRDEIVKLLVPADNPAPSRKGWWGRLWERLGL